MKSFDGEPASYRRFLELLAAEIPHAQALLISTLPRGGTQIVQPPHVNDPLIRAYNRELFAYDKATWQVILRDQPLPVASAWSQGEFEGSPFQREVLEPNGLRHGIVAKVPSPIFKGYPAALHLYRDAAAPDFTPQELHRLGEVAEALGQSLIQARQTRLQGACGLDAPWDHPGCCRQFVFDATGRQVQIYKNDAAVDDRLRQGLRQQVKTCLAGLNGELVVTNRAELPDARGEVWAFRTVMFKKFPALGEGPFVFLCLQPAACEWATVRHTDFAADPEMSRLVPTLKFMQAEFQHSPTLNEIAAKAHLSPFHFHRRFTELLGLTPKHFLLACQIHRAKELLIGRRTPLAEIASQCGFAHQSHFTSRFKQATGLTPTRWRRIAVELVGSGSPQQPPAGCAA